jgi:hypothetical protein
MKMPFFRPVARESTLDIKTPQLLANSRLSHLFAALSGRARGADGATPMTQPLLLLLAGLFVALGGAALHFSMHIPLWRLIILGGGWTLAWGASFWVGPPALS